VRNSIGAGCLIVWELLQHDRPLKKKKELGHETTTKKKQARTSAFSESWVESVWEREHWWEPQEKEPVGGQWREPQEKGQGTEAEGGRDFRGSKLPLGERAKAAGSFRRKCRAPKKGVRSLVASGVVFLFFSAPAFRQPRAGAEHSESSVAWARAVCSGRFRTRDLSAGLSRDSCRGHPMARRRSNIRSEQISASRGGIFRARCRCLPVILMRTGVSGRGGRRHYFDAHAGPGVVQARAAADDRVRPRGLFAGGAGRYYFPTRESMFSKAVTRQFEDEGRGSGAGGGHRGGLGGRISGRRLGGKPRRFPGVGWARGAASGREQVVFFSVHFF